MNKVCYECGAQLLLRPPRCPNVECKNHKLDLDEVRMLLNEKVDEELAKAIMKHGVQENISIEMQYMITAEEFGEIAKDLIDGNYTNAKVEIAQTMAMLIKLYWHLNNKE